MWPIVFGMVRRFVPYVMLPVTGLIGYVGYHLEGWISDRYTPATAPVLQQREERFLENIDSGVARKKHNPLEVNLSPSLSS